MERCGPVSKRERRFCEPLGRPHARDQAVPGTSPSASPRARLPWGAVASAHVQVGGVYWLVAGLWASLAHSRLLLAVTRLPTRLLGRPGRCAVPHLGPPVAPCTLPLRLPPTYDQRIRELPCPSGQWRGCSRRPAWRRGHSRRRDQKRRRIRFGFRFGLHFARPFRRRWAREFEKPSRSFSGAVCVARDELVPVFIPWDEARDFHLGNFLPRAAGQRPRDRSPRGLAAFVASK